MASVPADGVSPGSAAGTPPRVDVSSMRLGLQSLGGRSAIVGRRLGVVARRVGTFGRLIGVSAATRRSILPGTGPGLEVVRLPEGVWPQPQQAEDPYAALVSADPGMAAIAAMYRRRGAATPQPVVRRGLPSSARRGAVTASGPMTGPTSLARRLQPAEARVRRNESHATESTRSSPPPRPQPAAPAATATSGRVAAAGPSAASSRSTGAVAGRARPAVAGSSTGPDEQSEVARAADVYRASGHGRQQGRSVRRGDGQVGRWIVDPVDDIVVGARRPFGAGRRRSSAWRRGSQQLRSSRRGGSPTSPEPVQPAAA